MNTDQVQDLVEIDRFECNYILETARSDPVELQVKLDGIARNLLPVIWENTAGAVAVDSAIYFIKDLVVDLDIDLNINDQETASIWCRAIRAAITDRILSGRDVIRFSGRVEYISGLIGDLLADRARDRWYYRDLNELQNLSKGSAIMRVLRDNCGIIEPVLLSVSEVPGKFDELCELLTDTDLSEIYETLLPYEHIGSVSISEVIRTLRDHDALIQGRYNEPDYRTFLSVYLSILRRMFGGASEKVSSENTLIRSVLMRGSIIHIPGLYELMRSPAYHEVCESLRAGNSDRAEKLAHGTPYEGSVSFWSGIVRLEGCELINEITAAAEAGSPKVFHSMAGGLFLLAEHILRLDPVALAQDAELPPLSGYKGVHWLIASLAVKLTGLSAAETVQDKGIAIFAGMQDTPAFNTGVYADLVTSGSAGVLMSGLLGKFHMNGLLQGDYLWLQKYPEKNLVLVQDVETGLICWAEYYSGQNEQEAFDTVNRFIEAYRAGTSQLPGCLIFGREFAADINTAELDKSNVKFIVMETDFMYNYPENGCTSYRIQKNSISGNVSEIVIDGNGTYMRYMTNLTLPVNRYLGRLKPKQPADQHMVCVNPGSCNGHDLGLAVSLASGAVMKMFVRELRGFEHSSPGYILKNFLSGDSVIEADENTIRVQISGIPLAVVLTMAGVCPGHFRVPWIYDRDIEVTLR